MSKQERIAECEEMIATYNREYSDWNNKLINLTKDNSNSERRYIDNELTFVYSDLAHWRKELEAAQAMPDDTAQVLEAETFLLEATKDTEIEFEIDADYDRHVDLELTMTNSRTFPDVTLSINHSDSSVSISWHSANNYNYVEASEFAGLMLFAGEIALKWQAHVSHLEGLVPAKEEFGRSASLIKAVKEYRAITGLGLAESKKAVKAMLASDFISEDS